MAYKALNKVVVKELNLKAGDVNNAFAAATVVFAIQFVLISFIFSQVTAPIFPNNI